MQVDFLQCDSRRARLALLDFIIIGARLILDLFSAMLRDHGHGTPVVHSTEVKIEVILPFWLLPVSIAACTPVGPGCLLSVKACQQH